MVSIKTCEVKSYSPGTENAAPKASKKGRETDQPWQCKTDRKTLLLARNIRK